MGGRFKLQNSVVNDDRLSNSTTMYLGRIIMKMKYLIQYTCNDIKLLIP